MRITRILLLMSLAAALTGCGGSRSRGRWEREVPVTPPSGTDSSSTAPTSQPASAPDSEPLGPDVKVEGPTPLIALVGDPDPHKQPPLPRIQPEPEDNPPVPPPAEPHPEPKPEPRPKDVPTSRPTPEPKVQPEPAPVAEPKPHPILDRPTVVAGSVLQVNERFITVKDILRSAHGRLADLPRHLSEPVFQQRAAEIINEEIRGEVSRALVLAEAERRLTDQHKERIKAEVEEFERELVVQADGSRTKLQQSLAKEGTTLQALLDDHTRRLKIQTYLQTKFMPAISINRRMLWDYYRRYRSRYTAAKRVQMQIIAAPFHAFLPRGAGQPTDLERQAARTKARHVADSALSAVRDGEEFAVVARRLSRGIKASAGGIWPIMAADNFREEKVEQAAFALKEGQVSGIVEAPAGYYIAKALVVDPGKTVSFEQAQEEIDEVLRQKQYGKLVDAYLKRLLEGATIVQSEKFMLLTVSRATEEYWRR